jgi:hypothetical protein
VFQLWHETMGVCGGSGGRGTVSRTEVQSQRRVRLRGRLGEMCAVGAEGERGRGVMVRTSRYSKMEYGFLY